MSDSRFVTIDARFRGPPDSGNAGYVCGMVAAAAGEPVAVRLKRPPPLGVPLAFDEADGVLRLMQGETIVAEARPAAVDLEVPPPPDHAEAVIASLGYIGFARHPFPGCFVCGPKRLAGDGLRIFAGPLGERSLVAAPWIPDGTLAGPAGTISPEFLWEALDCPGCFATQMAGRLALLGELAARIERPLRPGGALRHHRLGAPHGRAQALRGHGDNRPGRRSRRTGCRDLDRREGT